MGEERLLKTNLVRAAAAAVILLGPLPVTAQEESAGPSSQVYVGGSVGLWGSGRESLPLELFTIGFRASKARTGALGTDFAVGTIPRLIPEGGLPLGSRLGLTLPIGSSDVLWWPSAGVGAAVAFGGGDAWGRATGYVGMGLTAFRPDEPSGLRIDFTLHRLNGAAYWLVEFGVVRRR